MCECCVFHSSAPCYAILPFSHVDEPFLTASGASELRSIHCKRKQIFLIFPLSKLQIFHAHDLRLFTHFLRAGTRPQQKYVCKGPSISSIYRPCTCDTMARVDSTEELQTDIRKLAYGPSNLRTTRYALDFRDDESHLQQSLHGFSFGVSHMVASRIQGLTGIPAFAEILKCYEQANACRMSILGTFLERGMHQLEERLDILANRIEKVQTDGNATDKLKLLKALFTRECSSVISTLRFKVSGGVGSSISLQSARLPIWVAYLKHKPFAVNISQAISNYRIEHEDPRFDWLNVFRFAACLLLAFL